MCAVADLRATVERQATALAEAEAETHVANVDNERLDEENKELHAQNKRLNEGLAAELDRADTLQRQVEAMRGALEYYADAPNYFGGNRAKILNDGGGKARETIAALTASPAPAEKGEEKNA